MSTRDKFDWDEIQARIERAAVAVEEIWKPTPARAREILDQRARRLALAGAGAAPATADLELLVFRVGTERYALDSSFVRTVTSFVSFTPIPGAPPQLPGVANHRGEILPVVDLRPVFGLEIRGLQDVHHALVLGRDSNEFALLIDRAEDVTRVQLDEVLPPPARAKQADPLPAGVLADGVIVLDGEGLLADGRFRVTHDSHKKGPSR